MNKKSLVALSLTTFLGLLSCGGGGSSSSDDFFFTSAKQTAPVITATATSSVHTSSANWNFGNVMYEIYNSLRDYDDAVNGLGNGGSDIIGLDNIYKVLFQTGQFYADGKARCTTITAKEITSPFNFGNTETYSCVINDTANKHGVAIDENASAGTKKAILSWRVNNNSDELGVIQGNYNSTTGDVDIDMTTYVDYTGQPDFSLRSKITGNEKTHLFTLKIIKYSAEGGYNITLVGHGISKGTGNHFLFKASDSNGIVNKYYCFPADATEADLKAMDDAGSATVPAACAEYTTIVDALVPFEPTDDLPHAATDFNKGNANEGDIYIFGI